MKYHVLIYQVDSILAVQGFRAGFTGSCDVFLDAQRAILVSTTTGKFGPTSHCRIHHRYGPKRPASREGTCPNAEIPGRNPSPRCWTDSLRNYPVRPPEILFVRYLCIFSFSLFWSQVHYCTHTAHSVDAILERNFHPLRLDDRKIHCDTKNENLYNNRTPVQSDDARRGRNRQTNREH